LLIKEHKEHSKIKRNHLSLADQFPSSVRIASFCRIHPVVSEQIEKLKGQLFEIPTILRKKIEQEKKLNRKTVMKLFVEINESIFQDSKISFVENSKQLILDTLKATLPNQCFLDL